MTFCTGCGTRREGTLFCTGCGRRVDDPTPVVAGDRPGEADGGDRAGEAGSRGRSAGARAGVDGAGAVAVADGGGAWVSEPRTEPPPGVRVGADRFTSVSDVAATAPPAVVDEPGRFGRERVPGPVSGRALLLSGWPRAAAAAGVMLAVVLVGCAVAGTAVALAAVADVGVLVDAVTLSVPLLFAAFGVRVGASDITGPAPIGYLLESPALPWMALGVAAALRAMRSAAAPLERDRGLLLALVTKVTFVFTALMGVLAVVVPRLARRLGVEVLLNPWEATLVPLIVVGLCGLGFLVGRGVFPVPAEDHPGLRRGVRVIRAGFGAYGIVLVAMTALVVAAGLALPVPTSDLPAAAAALLVGGATLGALASAVATGSTIETTTGPIGLASFSLPPAAGAPAAPRLLLLILAIVPVVVAWRTWRALARERPRDRRAALTVAAYVGAGFVLAAWTALLGSRRVLFSALGGSYVVRFTASVPLGRALASMFVWAMAASLVPALLRRLPPASAPPPGGDRSQYG